MAGLFHYIIILIIIIIIIATSTIAENGAGELKHTANIQASHANARSVIHGMEKHTIFLLTGKVYSKNREKKRIVLRQLKLTV